MEDGADSVDNGHEAVAYRLEQGLDTRDDGAHFEMMMLYVFKCVVDECGFK